MKRSLLLFPIVLMILIAVACGPGAAPTATPTPKLAPTPTPTAAPVRVATPTAAPTPTPTTVAAIDRKQMEQTGVLKALTPNAKRGGTFKIGGWTPPQHYDLDQSTTILLLAPTSPMYEGLIRRNPFDGGRTMIPDLATKWQVSSDGLTYTFTMRPNVKWHDGTPLSADDVVATYQRRIKPPEGVVSIRKGLYNAIKSVDAVDPLTVRFVLTEPQAFMIEAFSAGWSIIYSKKSLTENNQDLRRLAGYPGTGPFKYVDWKPEKLVMERNPNYWNPDLPYVDRVERWAMTDAEKGTAVLTGQLDYGDFVTVDTFEEGQKKPDIITTKQTPATWAQTVTLNVAKPPLNDVRIRRALHLAISRQDTATAAAKQFGFFISRWSPTGEFATPYDEVERLPGYRADKTKDREEAKRLMADAGLADGAKGLILLARGAVGTSDPGVTALSFIDQAKSVLKLEFNVQMAETSVYWDTVAAGGFHATTGVPACGITDPSDCFGQWFKTGGPQNYAKYNNANFDNLWLQINREMDPVKRKVLVRQAEDILDQDVPMVFVGWNKVQRMWRNYVKDLYFGEVGTYIVLRYDTVWLDR